MEPTRQRVPRAAQPAPGPAPRRPNARLTPEVRERVLVLHRTGHTVAEIAKETHATARQVRDVIRRAERRNAARIAELVRAGIMVPPALPKGLLPEPLVVPGGLSRYVLAERE